MLKALSWRLISSCVTLSITLLVGINIKIALGITSIDFVVKILAYYLHERAWLAKWGKHEK